MDLANQQNADAVYQNHSSGWRTVKCVFTTKPVSFTGKLDAASTNSNTAIQENANRAYRALTLHEESLPKSALWQPKVLNVGFDKEMLEARNTVLKACFIQFECPNCQIYFHNTDQCCNAVLRVIEFLIAFLKDK